jgi:multidrug efflux system membrane fusion protein
MPRLLLLELTLFLAALCLVGCRPSGLAGEGPGGPPTVSVSQPVVREITDYALFTGRTEAVDAVDVKSRVTGYVLNTPFQEGSMVKKGELLFVIDPREYQAELDAAQGQLQAAQARYQLAKTENERAKALYKENPAAVSQKQLDQHQAAEDSAAADVVAAKSGMEVYQLNVDFTRITSPIDGRVGRYQVTVGNLVTQNVTSLTTVVSQDPIYAYFSIDEQTMLAALRSMYAGTLPTLASRKVPALMSLQDEQGFPHRGTVDFANNTVDPTTGTLTVRAEFANPANEKDLRLLMPGMFVRIRLPLSKPHDGVLVIDRAVGTDQGQKFVYVVDDQGVVQYRRVTLGPLEDDGLRVIKEGLEREEWVVVDGLQIVRPKTKVKVRRISMPTSSATRASKSSAAADDRGEGQSAPSDETPANDAAN